MEFEVEGADRMDFIFDYDEVSELLIQFDTYHQAESCWSSSRKPSFVIDREENRLYNKKVTLSRSITCVRVSICN